MSHTVCSARLPAVLAHPVPFLPPPPPPPPSPNNTHSHVRPASPASPPADVSFQAYSLLRGYLQHFPYASLRYHEEGQWAGRPYVAIDEGAAWEPLAANR